VNAPGTEVPRDSRGVTHNERVEVRSASSRREGPGSGSRATRSSDRSSGGVDVVAPDGCRVSTGRAWSVRDGTSAHVSKDARGHGIDSHLDRRLNVDNVGDAAKRGVQARERRVARTKCRSRVRKVDAVDLEVSSEGPSPTTTTVIPTSKSSAKEIEIRIRIDADTIYQRRRRERERERKGAKSRLRTCTCWSPAGVARVRPGSRQSIPQRH